MMTIFTAVAIGVLFAVGVFQLLRRNVVRSVLGLIILANAINLFLLSSGAVSGVAPAYDAATGVRSDALPQALILTAIVISMAGMSLLLSLIFVLSARRKTSDLDEVNQLRY